MPVTVRPLTEEEIPAAYELGRLAFGGGPVDEVRAPYLRPVPGATRYGAFDAAGRLVGKATDIGHEQWWGGRRLVAADVGGVAVAAESRGGGVARLLLAALLAEARDRGAAVSALHPTVSATYRSFGWEVAGLAPDGLLDLASLPTRTAPGITLRPGGPADRTVAHTLYEREAVRHNGLLTRAGGMFAVAPNNPLGEDVDLLTVAEAGGEPVGVLALGRGRGYGPEAKLRVHQLDALTADAARVLVSVLGGWRTVARSARIAVPVSTAVATTLPFERLTEVDPGVWMHRPVDVVRAVTERGWPPYAVGRVRFGLVDDLAPWNSGDWELVLEAGRGELTRSATAPDRWLHVRGFAALYCGVATGAGLVSAGLAGGSGDPAALDLLGCGPAARLLDYF